MTLEPRTVLGVVGWYTEKIGYPPTIRELAIELDVAPSTVAKVLDELEAEGRISRVPGSPRTLRVIERKAEA